MKNYSQKGFTIVELLIVIVVIGILAALVLNSFSGVQAKARDTERDTDVKAITTQLEAFYNGDGQGSYPATYDATQAGSNTANVNLRNDTDASAKLKGMDLNSMRAPGLTSNTIEFAQAPGTVTPTVGTGAQSTTAINVTKDKYVYQPLTAANAICGPATSSAADTTFTCTKYKLFYVREGASAVVQTKLSLNQ